jgi:hypothetical protein
MNRWWEDELTPVTDDKEWERLCAEALEWARREGLISDAEKKE